MLVSKLLDSCIRRNDTFQKKLQLDFNEIECQALKEFLRIYYINGIGINGNKKDFAIEALKTKYSAILFKLYNKRSYNEIIWKLIKPKFSKPFKDGFEDNI